MTDEQIHEIGIIAIHAERDRLMMLLQQGYMEEVNSGIGEHLALTYLGAVKGLKKQKVAG